MPPALELYDPSAYQNLGLLYLGGALKDKYECKYIDLSETNIIPDADFNLITVLQATYISALETVRLLAGNTDSKIIVGGIEVTVNPEKAYSDFHPHCAVCGEAELQIENILNNNITGIHDCGVVKNLDEAAFPDRDLIPLDKLRNVSSIHGDRYSGDGASTTIITSRGCPYKCTFCCKIPQTSYFRWRSASNVHKEMVEIKTKYDISHFRFIDDCFTANKKRVFDLCSLLKDNDFYWMCCTRADLVNASLLKEMYNAGCREIAFGVESGSQRMIDIMNKEETIEQYIKTFKLVKEAGIKIKILLMENYPGETPDDVVKTMDFVKTVQPDKWTLSSYVALHGSAKSMRMEPYGKFFYPMQESKLKLWLKNEEWKYK